MRAAPRCALRRLPARCSLLGCCELVPLHPRDNQIKSLSCCRAAGLRAWAPGQRGRGAETEPADWLHTDNAGRKNTTHSGLGLASAATLTALRRLGALLRKAGRACGTLHLTDPRWARTRCCCIIFLLLLFLAACFNRCCATALLLFFSAARQLARRVFTLVVIRVQVLGAVSICFVVAESGTCVCS